MDAAEVTEHREIGQQEQGDEQDPVGIYLLIAKNAKNKDTTTLNAKKDSWLGKHSRA